MWVISPRWVVFGSNVQPKSPLQSASTVHLVGSIIGALEIAPLALGCM